MESEKAKQSTSAASAASTAPTASAVFGLAAVLSAVRGTPDSDDDIWSEENLNRSQVKSPKQPAKTSEPLEAKFEFHHDGAWRDEIEVEIQTKNKKKFTGTITPIEAKHQIYIKGLGFDDHSNFDGVRVNFKGKLIVTFKLINPINIDELEAVEHFDFVRTATVNGKSIADVIGCRIRGIRYRPMMVSSFDNAPKDDGQKVVKIEGCEYRVTKDEILQWLSFYGEVTSNLEEDVFKDEFVSDGNNRTGNYTVMMKLDRPIPQLLPMCGRRIKMYHAGIQKLCTNCFGPHRKQHCESSEKVPWIQYVRNFIEANDEMRPEMFGKWIDILQRVREEASQDRQLVAAQSQEKRNEPSEETNENEPTPKQSQLTQPQEKIQEKARQDDEIPPTEEDFNIPTTKESYESMIEKFNAAGLSNAEADEAIKTRTTAFNKASREFKKKMIEKRKQDGQKGRRNSLKKQ